MLDDKTKIIAAALSVVCGVNTMDVYATDLQGKHPDPMPDPDQPNGPKGPSTPMGPNSFSEPLGRGQA